MNLIKYTKYYLLISLVILVPGVISLFVYGLNLAVDFSGGSVIEYSFSKDIENPDEVETKLNEIFTEKKVEVDEITVVGSSRVLVRTKPLDVHINEEIKTEVVSKLEGSSQVSFETVGPAVGKETTNRSLLAVLVASIGILLYIAYSFRNVPKPYSSFKFGITAIIAMLHDVFVILGIFSILGHFFNVEIDALFITALLTIIGFSVHDTIVVFDRIRENLNKLPHSMKFSEIVNYSLVETLNRSLATSVTVLITLSALFLLGGETIKYFTLALIIGIASGTYSSIFNASPLLVLWEEHSNKKKA